MAQRNIFKLNIGNLSYNFRNIDGAVFALDNWCKSESVEFSNEHHFPNKKKKVSLTNQSSFLSIKFNMNLFQRINREF